MFVGTVTFAGKKQPIQAPSAVQIAKDFQFQHSVARRTLPAAPAAPTAPTGAAAVAPAAAAAGAPAAGAEAAVQESAGDVEGMQQQQQQQQQVAPVKPKAQSHSLFQDESLPTFFRRLAWSPDGVGERVGTEV